MSSYPITPKGKTEDHYFGETVADPYRWLEDDRSPETTAWVQAQNRVTFAHLKEIPYQPALKKRLLDLWNYEKIGAPFVEGAYTYYYKNDGLQNQHVVYRKKQGLEKEEVFLDPNTFSEDGTTALMGLYFSKDGSLAAYLVSEGGSDWRKVIVLNTETLEQVGETLVDVKFSGIAWKGTEGFYYSSYDKPDGSELSAMTDWHKLYYHCLGTPQTQDQVVFGATVDQKHRYVGGSLSEDEQFLTISAANSTSGNKLFIQDLKDAEAPLVPIVSDMDSDTHLLHNVGTQLYLVTNREAPNKKVVRVQAQNPSPEHWEDFIPETEQVLSVSTAGGHFFAHYMVDALSKVYHYDPQGNMIREVALPGPGSAHGFSAKTSESECYFSFTNYHTPASILVYNISVGTARPYWSPKVHFDSSQYISEQLFYTAKDGTRIPIIVTHKEGLDLNGKNPTILYGYGGFNISLSPAFSIATVAWLEQGGIYAVPNLRGGGEYGKKWHLAGTKLQKQNVFDDFIAAAEHLFAKGYTSSPYLALRGGSNGGLLVGATMTQRPDLAQVALPAVGVLDMLRYHTFTAGAGWAYDYGTSEESEEMYRYLRGYSPLHNVREGVAYPATLISTGDHDDRVVPAHSFKFAAELQAKQKGPNPVLIRIETNAGHGAGTPVDKTVEQYADTFAFALYHMGFTALPHPNPIEENR